MKCEFCGKVTDTLHAGPKGIKLCETCCNQYKISQEEKKMNEKNVVEFPVESKEEQKRQETPQDQQIKIKCEVVIGVTEDGGMYFNVGGSSADLLTVDGLLKYGERYMKNVWAAREEAVRKAKEAKR